MDLRAAFLIRTIDDRIRDLLSDTESDSVSSALTSYSDLYPMAGKLNGAIQCIDLTSLADNSDDEDGPNGDEGNCYANRFVHNSLFKFTFYKVIRRSKLKRRTSRAPTAERIHPSLWSKSSKAHYEELKNKQKATYVADVVNPFLDKGLYAAVNIKAGEFINLYEGERQAKVECEARQKRGRTSAYALDIGSGIIIDAYGFPYGAAMANHSCEPNARLRRGHLRGWEKAPFGYMQAIKDISMGTAIEVDYGYIRDLTDRKLKSIIESNNYMKCRCMAVSCKGVFATIDEDNHQSKA